MAVWNACTMLRFRAFSSFCRTPVLCKKSEDELSAIVLKLNKPKRPATGFFRFLVQNGPELRRTNPEVSPTEIPKIASKMWATLPEKEKASYNLAYSMEMEEYKSQMQKYSKEVEAFENKKLLSAKSKLKETDKMLMGKPQRPSNVYFLFVASMKKSSPVTLTPSALKEKWEACPDYEKKKFEEEYKEAKEKYQKELLKWEEEMYKKGYTRLIRSTVLAKLKKSEAVQ